MESVSDINRRHWNDSAALYAAREHDAAVIHRILENPQSAFHPATWAMIAAACPSLEGRRVLVPSSGDNHAVFAFAQLGARVTSCDISENQLANAERVARANGLDVEFTRADTMALSGISEEVYDLAYTSNGVHVWINDLPAMYRAIHRAMKPGAAYVMYELHPFHRPFDGKAMERLNVMKPYDATGPFKGESDITFAWRVQDILNAMLDAGLNIRHVEEMRAQISYDDPDWIPHSQKLSERGRVYDRAEVDRMYDWRINPMAALPHWLSVAAIRPLKEETR